MLRKRAIESALGSDQISQKDNFFHVNAAHNYIVKNKIESLETYREKYKKYRNDWVSVNQHIINKKTNITNPLCIDIEVASICDLACPFCYRQHIVTPDKIMSDELAKSLVDQAIELGTPSIKFNWRGEPLLNPNLEKYIKRAKQGGITETLINTNATQLSKTRALKLIQSGLDTLIYSFDGGSKETYEKNRPGRFKKNNFEDILNNIKTFHKTKKELNSPFPYTKIQMILTEDTRKEIDSFYNFFKDIVDEVNVKQYTERGGDLSLFSKEEKNKITKELNQKNVNVDNCEFLISNNEIYYSTARIPCEQPFQRLLITYEGRIGMCCYDWGAKYAVGFANKELIKKSEKDYEDVKKRIENNNKEFNMMKPNMPIEMNPCKIEESNLRDTWNGNHIVNVREKMISSRHADISICSNCPFKETYEWKKINSK